MRPIGFSGNGGKPQIPSNCWFEKRPNRQFNTMKCRFDVCRNICDVRDFGKGRPREGGRGMSESTDDDGVQNEGCLSHM